MPPLRELHRSKDRLPLPHLKLQVEERKPEKIKSAPHKSYYKARRPASLTLASKRLVSHVQLM